MADDLRLSNLKYILLPVIALLFVIFSPSLNDSGNFELVNVPCSSAVIIVRDFGKSSLSNGQNSPQKQSVYNLGQTAVSSSVGQLPFLESRNIFSHDVSVGLLRIREGEIKYDLVITSNTGRSPPLFIS